MREEDISLLTPLPSTLPIATLTPYAKLIIGIDSMALFECASSAPNVKS